MEAPFRSEWPLFGVDLTWPDFGTTNDVRPALRKLREAGEPAALATLFAVEGGAPRGVGAQMAFGPGVVSGFFSGGCLETDVAFHARAVLDGGGPRRLVYGRGSPWLDIALLCGARMDILVERIEPNDPALDTLLDPERRLRVWSTDGADRHCRATDEAEHEFKVTEVPFRIERLQAPTTRLLVVGGDPTAMTIAELGSRAGFETILVRPNGPPAAPELPGVAYSRASPAEAFLAAGVDRWTAVAVATHEFEVDEAALLAALPSAAGYVGVLGARGRIGERVERLRDAGVGEADLARLHAPIGLPIGGKSPWTVAVSVIGEIMQENHRAHRS